MPEGLIAISCHLLENVLIPPSNTQAILTRIVRRAYFPYKVIVSTSRRAKVSS